KLERRQLTVHKQRREPKRPQLVKPMRELAKEERRLRTRQDSGAFPALPARRLEPKPPCQLHLQIVRNRHQTKLGAVVPLQQTTVTRKPSPRASTQPRHIGREVVTDLHQRRRPQRLHKPQSPLGLRRALKLGKP